MLKTLSKVYNFPIHKLYVNPKLHFSTIKEILNSNKPGDKITVKASIQGLPHQKC